MFSFAFRHTWSHLLCRVRVPLRHARSGSSHDFGLHFAFIDFLSPVMHITSPVYQPRSFACAGEFRGEKCAETQSSDHPDSRRWPAAYSNRFSRFAAESAASIWRGGGISICVKFSHMHMFFHVHSILQIRIFHTMPTHDPTRVGIDTSFCNG